MKRALPFLLVLQLSVLTAFAQTAQDDLKKMTAVYRSAHSYQMQIAVKFYMNDQPEANVSYTGQAAKSGDRYFSRMMGRTTLFNNRCRLLVDDERQLIVYNDPAGKKEIAVTPEEQLFMDSAFYAEATVRYISRSEAQIRIEVKTGSQAFERMEIVMNAKTHVLEQVVYYHKKTPGKTAYYTKSEISYTGVTINAQISDELFSEKKYILRSRSRVAGSGRYAAYKVVDQTTVKHATE